MPHGRITKHLIWWSFKHVRVYGFAFYFSRDRNPVLTYARQGSNWLFQIGRRTWQRVT